MTKAHTEEVSVYCSCRGMETVGVSRNREGQAQKFYFSGFDGKGWEIRSHYATEFDSVKI